MKIAILCESEFDQMALRILINALLSDFSESVEDVAGAPPLVHSWPQPLNLSPAVLKGLYYWSDAAALVVVADSNGSTPHSTSHDEEPGSAGDCRLCKIRLKIAAAHERLAEVPGRGQLRVAIGLGVPEIHAWYRCLDDPGVNETAWINGLRAGRPPYTKVALKRAVFGTDHPDPALRREKTLAAAQRLAQDLARLEEDFPGGFGTLAREVRSWVAPG